MKALIILLSISVTSILGMLYWMYKARKGTLYLKETTWHFKLVKYVWDSNLETNEIRNACPYYWSIILSLFMFPSVLIIKFIGSVITLINSKLPERKIKPKVYKEKKKSKYSDVYSKSKEILEITFAILIAVLIAGFLLAGYVGTFMFSIKVGIIATLIILFVVVTILLHEFKPELDQFHLNHYSSILKGLIGIFKIPFLILSFVLSAIFSKITKVYTDNCPPIIWTK